MRLEDPKAFYYGLPLVTRAWFTIALVTTIGAAIGIVPLGMINLSWGAVISRFHVWRILTHVFFMGKVSIAFLFNLFWMIKFSGQLERSPYPPADAAAAGGVTGDYAWMVILGALGLTGLNGLIVLVGPMWLKAWAMSSGSLGGEALLSFVIFVWSRRFPSERAGIWMITTVGFYFPWLVLAFTLLLGGDPTATLAGYLVGATYILFVDTLPRADPEQWGSLAGTSIVYTPKFMYDLIEWAESRPAAADAGEDRRAAGPFVGAGRMVG